MIKKPNCLLCGRELTPLDEGSDLQTHPDVEDCEVKHTDAWGIAIELEESEPEPEPAGTISVEHDPDDLYQITPMFPLVEDCITNIFADYGLPRQGGASSGRGWTSVSTFQRCWYLWKQRYLVNGDKRGPLSFEHPARAIGTLVHAFLALYYSHMIEGSPFKVLSLDVFKTRLMLSANPELVNEGWRVFVAYRLWYSMEEVIPLAIEHDLRDPRTGESCRYDLIAWFPGSPDHGLLSGVYNIEHKCLPGSARVFDTTYGGYRRIDALFSSGAELMVLSINAHRLRAATASAPFANGVREVYSMRLESGRGLRASENHPVLTPVGWKPVGALKPGDWVAVPIKTGGQIRPVSLLGRFVGMMLGDGHMASQIGFTQNEGPVLDAFRQVVAELDYASTESLPSPGRHSVQIRFPVAVGAPVQTLMVGLGLLGRTSGDKFVPESLQTEEFAASIIGGLWDTDGCIHVRATDAIITYTTKSRQLAEDLQRLLLMLGVDSMITKTWATSWQGERVSYCQLKIIGRRSKRVFCEGLVAGWIPTARLASKATEALAVGRERDNDPIPVELLKQVIGDGYRASHWLEAHRQHIIGALYRHKRNGQSVSITRGVVEEWAAVAPELNACLWDVLWDRVESVIAGGREMVYNLTVAGTQNFVADDVITHNTAGRFDRPTLEGWQNDGEVIGQNALWQRLGLDKRFGPLRGTIVNILGKQKEPKFHRTFVAPDSFRIQSHLDDLRRWEGLIALAKSANNFPRSRGNCINRFGLCDLYEQCAASND